MQTPANPFKNALAQRQPQIGLWLGLANAYCAEICAGAGFDWLLVDGEHAPNGLTDILVQLQAIAAYPGAHAIARVPVGEAALIKQYLDIGAQTLLVPMVDTAEQAAHLVRACRYPQDDGMGGIRGMAGARASRWGRYPNYAKEANDRVCLLVQAETRTALQNLDAIAATPGVDGVFIGPADLSASLGHVGDPNHPDVQAAIEDAIAAHPQGRQGTGHPDQRRGAGAPLPGPGRGVRRGGAGHRHPGAPDQRTGRQVQEWRDCCAGVQGQRVLTHRPPARTPA
jgi:4-hydroxy-2-oxoheptanedioate aldolase